MVLPFGSWVIFEVKDRSCERRTLHLVICQAKCRVNWYADILKSHADSMYHQWDMADLLNQGVVRNVVYVDPLFARVQEAVLLTAVISRSLLVRFTLSR